MTTNSQPTTKPTCATFQDTFIREVRINYQSTGELTFAIKGPESVAQFVRRMMIDNSREHFIALFLDGAHQVASFSIVSIGTANSALVHPRELFQRAIGAGAVSLVVGVWGAVERKLHIRSMLSTSKSGVIDCAPADVRQ